MLCKSSDELALRMAMAGWTPCRCATQQLRRRRAFVLRALAGKQKIIDKMVVKGLTPPVHRERTFSFKFPDCEKLPPPVMPFVDVAFSYSGKKSDYLYKVRLEHW